MEDFGRWRCWYALISARLSLPSRRVSYWASINCLLRSLLPWFSAMFQSVFLFFFFFFLTTQLYLFLKKKPVPSASTNCCSPQTNCSTSCIYWISFSGRGSGLGWWFEPDRTSFGESLYKLTPLARGWFWNRGFEERKEITVTIT